MNKGEEVETIVKLRNLKVVDDVLVLGRVEVERREASQQMNEPPAWQQNISEKQVHNVAQTALDGAA